MCVTYRTICGSGMRMFCWMVDLQTVLSQRIFTLCKRHVIDNNLSSLKLIAVARSIQIHYDSSDS